jgi:nicotinamidase/pyrazinamidase
MMKALLIIDVQNDFIKGGALAVPDAEQVTPVINELMDKFDLVLATQDWHPQKSVHFKKWPIHCVAGSKGAEFPPELHKKKINQVFHKGTGDRDDGYSTFEATNIKPVDYLKKRGISDLYLCGIALEYCVKSSALDALKEGFKVFLIRDAIANFSKEEEKIAGEYAELQGAGAQIITSAQV